MLRGILTYSADERRATLAGVNLFFSALLGANLGALGDIALGDYFKLILLLVGAVTAILTIAVSKRRATVISTTIALAIVLASMALVPGFGGDRVADDLDRMVVTLSVWLAMLLLVRFTPGAAAPTVEATAIDEDEVVLPPREAVRQDGGGRN